MAKKAYIKKDNIHQQCVFCKEVTNEYLSIQGFPIMGECEYLEYRFLLREFTDCDKYKKR